ncbi:DNA translocase FtsK 4TM domain-containing protein [Octadecabacter sp. 1_MG-2023]|uniref:DNA translocase FtsK n=1 Tax=unclassified Octadecabacter TaxID=196158 RepID=UPI001C08DE9C|nr:MULTISPECIES: DNA translocase FtsK [unclassified Octadecabacter]MBU2992146.1 DNA translocase FtsK 4TM domain-containing protein [Octadecabacter sp. B2R22]MDO6735098.1 DNA translocase FtsK 4TM domain-containing protein [Octadecabacter sp. 1_MG-2023]
MASYQSRQRDPLLDSTTQAAIEKRGRELVGIGLFVAGLMVAMMLWSYAADDPNFMSATDAPVQNWLGRPGASFAAALFMIVGYASWMLPIVLMAWGLRFTMHYGQERAIGRMIFAPIAIAVTAIYAATLNTGAGWDESFGLGGHFGDMVLSILLTILPFGTTFAVKLMSFVMGLGVIALMAFALGFTMVELRKLGRFLLVGLIVAYSGVLKLLGQTASASYKGAQAFGSRVQERREVSRQEKAEYEAELAAARAVPAPSHAEETARVAAVVRANPAMPTRYEDFDPIESDVDHAPAATRDHVSAAPLAAPVRAAEPEQKSGLFASLLKRNEPMPEPELIEEPSVDHDLPVGDNDRISARIASAVRSRSGQPQEVQIATKPGVNPAITAAIASRMEPLAEAHAARIEPPVAKPTGPRPLVLNTEQQAAVAEQAPIADAPMAEFVEDYVEPSMEYIAADTAPIETPAAAFTPSAVPVPEAKAVVQHPPRKPVQPSRQAKAEAQPALKFDENKRPAYEMPPLGLLASPEAITRHVLSDEALEENARMLENVLDDYGVKGDIVSVRPGPVVTMYELEPAPGLKASRVIGLSDDIARSMSALSARVSTVPGRSVIGIELPNENREMVVLREMLSARDFGDSNMKLPLALGKDIGGEPIIANLAKMPHLLIAGTTGSGKSVAINTMILSLLYKLSPEECRMIMIDPKMLELSVYDGIPHLLSPVVTDPKKAVVALKWVVGEMEERYRKMSKMGVRNIDGYNGRVKDALAKGEQFSRTVQTGFDDDTGEPVFETDEFTPEILPYIVVIVDEMADLMMVAGKEIEACIQRLAQMARASGIHLIMATQRPSVDVITGTIKANFPTRISFQVTSKIDSRTILGEMGAEQLLGMGDMLYMAGGSKITRVHGPFCSDEEVEEIVNYLKAYGPPEYFSGVVEGPAEESASNIDQVLGLGGNTDGEDALYDTAVAIVAKDRKCSTSYIQRKLAIGYNKAARLVEQMEDEGIVSAANHVGKREILIPERQ